MRLWDPEVLRQRIETIQTLRPYYKFHDVDVDRYIIDGKPTLVMLSPRDIDIDGLATSARAWLNTTLQYTHGYGVTVSPVNTSTPSGEPTFLVKDMPPKAPPELKLDRPQLYFSDKRDAFGGLRDDYALVNTKVEEFEYPSEEGDKYTCSTSGRGVPVSGMLSRLAFSLVNADGNLLVSPNITPKPGSFTAETSSSDANSSTHSSSSTTIPISSSTKGGSFGFSTPTSRRGWSPTARGFRAAAVRSTTSETP